MPEDLTATNDAKALFREVLNDLLQPDRDLKLVLRKCQHAAQLLRWDAPREWFRQELSGYPAGAAIPAHRKVSGRLTWRPQGGVYDVSRGAVEDVVYGRPAKLADGPAALDVFANLDWILSATNTDYVEKTGVVDSYYSSSRQKDVPVEQIRMFDSQVFKFSVAEIDRITFDWASNAYAQVGYGEVLDNVWSRYRQSIDQKLTQLGLAGHLNAIESGLGVVPTDVIYRSA
ncbi:MAG: AbiTii domain-containing protein [Dehalococcoidia bacterium]